MLLIGQWGWKTNGEDDTKPFNSYIYFYQNKTCEFLNALNASSHNQAHCTWGVNMTDGVHQLKINLDDSYLDDNFANPEGWRETSTTNSVAITTDTYAAWISKWEQPDIETLLYGSWGWSTDRENVTAHILLHPEG